VKPIHDGLIAFGPDGWESGAVVGREAKSCDFPEYNYLINFRRKTMLLDKRYGPMSLWRLRSMSNGFD
jgi:hypothetical protein